MPTSNERVGLRGRISAHRSLSGTLAAAGVAQVLSVLSGVLVAISLGPQDRGYLAFLVVVSGVCGLLGSLGLPTAATYYIAHAPSSARRIVATLVAPGSLLGAAAVALQCAILIAI